MHAGRAHVTQHVRAQGEACRNVGSPLYAGLLARVADDVEAAGPAWRVLDAFAAWPHGSAFGLRLMGAVNRLVLTGAAPDLAPHFAPGGDAAAAWPAFHALIAERGNEVRELALAYGVQTNDVGRCAALAPAFLAVSGGRPLRLLEIGASAGLNLRFDRYRYDGRWGDPASPVQLRDRYEGAAPPFDPPRVDVAARSGCDPDPIDPTTDEGELTLLSFVWPDQAERVELLRGAIALARHVPVDVERAPAADWLERGLAEPPPEGVATVLFHSIVWQYLDEGERDRVRAAITRAGEAATAEAPLAWVRMEPDGADARVDVTTWPAGHHRLFARAGFHGRPVRWLA